MPSEELGADSKNYKRPVVLRGYVEKDDSDSSAVFIHGARFVSVTNDGRESSGRY